MAVGAHLPTERHILSEHEVALVESADLFESVSSRQEKRTGDPVDRTVLVRRSVATRERITGPKRRQQRVRSGEPEVREDALRRIDTAVGPQNLGTDDGDVRVRVEEGN